MERTLDNFLNGNYQPRMSSLDKNSIEADSLLFNTDKNPQTVSCL